MNKRFCNLGIIAHVDAGKTTITEQILFQTGVIRKVGSVDSGTSKSDFLDIERERGISVSSSFNTFEKDGIIFNLIDTPGHVDFSADLERALRVLDIAVLVVSAVEGIQAHTETIWYALEKLNIPTIIFINKIDRIGSDVTQVIVDFESEFGVKLISLNKVKKQAEDSVQIFDKKYNENEIEQIIETDDSALEEYFETGKIEEYRLDDIFQAAVENRKLFPVLSGSAKLNIGVETLIANLPKFVPNLKYDNHAALEAVVHSILFNKVMGKVANIRLYSGKVESRDSVFNQRLGKEEKITQVMKIQANKFHDVGYGEAGDIVAVSGMSEVKAGDILGKSNDFNNTNISLQQPLLTLKVAPKNKKEYPQLAEALIRLSDQDPTLDFEQLKDERELHIKIMGKIQIEILKSILSKEYGIETEFEAPTVIYKETPFATGYGLVRYTMPKPCWAVILFKLEPLERGAGVIFVSEVSVDKIKQRYQNEVERTIQSALRQGIKGWEVTDVKITMIDGEDHEIHSRAGDFAVATPMGIMNGLKDIGTKFLEPILKFKITASDEFLGMITSDIIRMRGSFDSPIQESGKFILKGLVPLSSSMEYPISLSSKTGGKGKISLKFDSYQECNDATGVIRPYKGISPLDRSKWILKARKALQ